LRAVEIIERNVRLQARFVNDLLDLSRLMRGKLTICRAPTRLDEVVLSATQSCQADAARAEIALETHVKPGLWVDADSDRIQQIVLNLVGNGIKFTPKGGRVAVFVGARDRQGRIIVEDTGAGIERDRLPELFQMFRQGQIAAQRAPGLGIGLSLVKSLVDLHGGRVWAESDGPGHGSRFTVELPLVDAPRPRHASPVAEARPTSMKILLVEDNNDARTMLAETFAQLSCPVRSAESGEAALDLLARESVDAILADIGLPGMDGYEFLRRARRLPSAAHTPAFALTGFGQESDLRKAREAGYVEHFVKPVNVEEIYQRIRSRLAHA
jgi:CheY-like chemotaxis protein